MHLISEHLKGEYDCWFSQFHPDYFFEYWPLKWGLLENSIMSGHFKQKADNYLLEHGLKNDYRAQLNNYEMTVFCTDMIVQRKLRKGKTIFVQEGMVDAMTPPSRFIKFFRLPQYLSLNTSLNGATNRCDIYCVGSEGYRNFFAGKGTDKQKITVTGIPNFDDIPRFLQNDFAYRDYLLICTSDIRECFGKEDRMGFLETCKQQVNGRDVIFKLHPNEIKLRAESEIRQVFGESVTINQEGNANHMVANCSELITQWSTLAYVGIVLGKKVQSFFNVEELKRLTPIQNGGTSAKNIARLCDAYMRYEGTGKHFLKQYKPSMPPFLPIGITSNCTIWWMTN